MAVFSHKELKKPIPVVNMIAVSIPVECIGPTEGGEYRVPEIGFPRLGWLGREAEIIGTTKAIG